MKYAYFVTNQKKVITKREDVTKQVSVKTLKKIPSSGKSVISTYSFLLGGRGKGGGFWLWALI